MRTIHWPFKWDNNPQIDNAKYLNVVMPMYNLKLNIAIIIQKDQEVYGNTIEMNQMIM